MKQFFHKSRTTKSGRTFRKLRASRIVSLTLLALCIALLIACGENLLVIDFLDGKNSKPLPDVTVTAPTFAAVTEGYTQPTAQKIIITNDGKSKVTVKSVTVSPDTAFTIGGSGSTVNKKSSIDTWTVQPKAALPRGERMAIITVTCSGTGGTAASNAVVTFAVTQPGAANLSVTAPTFAAVTEGYATRPAAESITITNNGSSPATISGVVVSTGSFEISGSESTVSANSSITSYTVQPKLGLTHGTHMAIITVLYDGGTTASAAVTFVVTQAAVTRELAVSAPAFTEVYTGYTQPAALSIVITNTGNAAATIASVTVPPDSDFTIGGSGSTVGAGSSIASWTVRPKAGLGVGTYKATITVTYDGTSGATTETAEVTFVVMQRERFVAVASDSNKAAYSSDGITWKESTMPSSGWVSVTYGGGKYVAVGGGKAAYSFDGINWTTAAIPTGQAWCSVTYGNGRFVAVASNTSIGIAYSDDGSTWRFAAATALVSSSNWHSITYGNGKFVAVAKNSIQAAHSTDGSSWELAPAATSLPSSADWYVTYGNGKFVAVAYGTSTSAYSIDGTGWTQNNMIISGNWRSITYGSNTYGFVALAYGGTWITYNAAPGPSPGGDWAAIGSLPPSTKWSSVTYGNFRYVAVAEDSAIAICSTNNDDPRTWTQTALPSSAKWSSVTHGVVAVQ